MKNNLHGKTLIGAIREHVIAWRKVEGWSRETVAQLIVEAHEQVGEVSGIVFEPETRDVCEIREVNAQRIFRWLDDETKSGNLLPANFIPSILAAMPTERRLACASEIMVMIGLGACLPSESDDEQLDINHVFEAQMAHGKALQAATAAVQNPTPENLEAADLHMTQAIEKTKRMSRLIAGAKKAANGTKAMIGRVFHRKQPA